MTKGTPYVLIVGEALFNYGDDDEHTTAQGCTFMRVDHMKPYTCLEMANEVGEAMLEAGCDTYVVLGAYEGWVHFERGAFARAEKVAA